MAWDRKYGVAAVIPAQIVKADDSGFVTNVEWTPGAGDVRIRKSADGGATWSDAIDLTTMPTYTPAKELWLFPVSIAEMTAKLVHVTFADASMKADGFFIETFGHASAMYPDDFSVASVAGATPADITAALTKIRKYLQLLARADAANATDLATELAELNASGGSGAGAYVSTTDALEALRNRGDAAWVTGSGGGGGLDAAGTRAALGMSAANLDAQLATKPNAAGVTTAVTAAGIPAATLAAAAAAPIAAKIKIVNETTIQGSGTALDPMRPA